MNLTYTVWPIISSFLLETFILFLLAAGFFLIHRTAKFLNIAHGDYVTLGAYLIYTLTSRFGWNIWITLAISMVVTGFLAILIDQISYKYLRGAPLALLLCSIGVALVVRYGIFMAWGGRFKKLTVTLPKVEMLGVAISGSLILAVIFGCFIISIAYYILNHTGLGATVRAVADNPELAESFGIDTEKTLKFVWFLSGGSAALAGVVLAFYRPLTFEMGFSWILLIIAVSILAGEKIRFSLLLVACAIIAGGMELGLFFIPEAYRMGIGFAILVIAIIVGGGLKR
ncbi:MAG: branched-chain amino acid ABC transporter permease [Deltaproteobacteria bacterium]|nr:MAG: branched-chain amino acid ABC transporter permease [Deltaproteobacteria bacterium]